MSFKFLLLLSFLLVGCGVKGDPIAPSGNKLPSLLENYDDIKVDRSLGETKKKR